MFLAIFAAWPAPNPPITNVLAVLLSSMGRRWAMASADPPSTIVIVRAFAAARPPLTGPSTKEELCASLKADMACKVAGPDVEVSRMTVPGWMSGSI